MNGKRKQRILYLAPILMLFLCLSCIAVIGLNTYRKLVFEHLSAFCEIAAENNPERAVFPDGIKRISDSDGAGNRRESLFGEIWLPCRRVLPSISIWYVSCFFSVVFNPSLFFWLWAAEDT